MKRKALVLCAAALAVALLAGCAFLFPTIAGSGYLTTSGYGYSGFTRLAASQAFRVHVIPDTVYSVQVTCDDNIVPYLVVVQDAPDSLRIELAQGYNYVGVTASAEVHMPLLTGLTLSGASQARVEPGISSYNPLTLALSGGSTADLLSLACGPVTADISGASTLTFAGAATSENLFVSGASTADLMSCLGTSAHVNISGASVARVNVSGTIDVYASGASFLYYHGTAPLVHDSSGGSQIVFVY